MIYRAILWAAHQEQSKEAVFSNNISIEGYVYQEKNLLAVLNNSLEEQKAILKLQGKEYSVTLSSMELLWLKIK